MGQRPLLHAVLQIAFARVIHILFCISASNGIEPELGAVLLRLLVEVLIYLWILGRRLGSYPFGSLQMHPSAFTTGVYLPPWALAGLSTDDQSSTDQVSYVDSESSAVVTGHMTCSDPGRHPNNEIQALPLPALLSVRASRCGRAFRMQLLCAQTATVECKAQ